MVFVAVCSKDSSYFTENSLCRIARRVVDRSFVGFNVLVYHFFSPLPTLELSPMVGDDGLRSSDINYIFFIYQFYYHVCGRFTYWVKFCVFGKMIPYNHYIFEMTSTSTPGKWPADVKERLLQFPA